MSDSELSPSNPALERLNVLVGEWELEITAMSFDPDPSAAAHGHVSFHWMENRSFLREHSEIADTKFPQSVAIIGSDDTAETYGMLYFDSRGISRIYQMSLTGDTWKLWRDFPGFSQRFTGTISKDGSVITARWEKSTDGSTWEHDFDQKYTKVVQSETSSQKHSKKHSQKI